VALRPAEGGKGILENGFQKRDMPQQHVPVNLEMKVWRIGE